MKYSIQTHKGDIWRTVSSDRAGHQAFDDLAAAVRCFNDNVDMARMIWPMRLVRDDGVVLRAYDPHQDMRLPGCRFEATRRLAYELWEAAGRPDGDDQKFWFEAQARLPQSNGVTDGADVSWLMYLRGERDGLAGLNMSSTGEEYQAGHANGRREAVYQREYRRYHGFTNLTSTPEV